MYEILEGNVYLITKTETSTIKSFYAHVATEELKIQEGAKVSMLDVNGTTTEIVQF